MSQWGDGIKYFNDDVYSDSGDIFRFLPTENLIQYLRGDGLIEAMCTTYKNGDTVVFDKEYLHNQACEEAADRLMKLESALSKEKE